MEHGQAVVEVGDATFAAEVERARGPVVVDFTAEWCAPCRVLAPVLDALAREREGEVKVVRVDVDASQATAERFGIRSMPTLLFFRDGKVVQQLVGAVPRRRIDEVLAQVAPGRPGAAPEAGR